MERKTKEQQVKEYLEKRGFGSSKAWWDASRVSYSLTAKEIIMVCNYLNRK